MLTFTMLMVSIMGDILEAAILTPSSWEPKKKRKKHWHFEKSSEVKPIEIIQEQKSPPFLELPHFYVTGDLDSSLTVEKAIRNTAFVPCVK